MVMGFLKFGVLATKRFSAGPDIAPHNPALPFRRRKSIHLFVAPAANVRRFADARRSADSL